MTDRRSTGLLLLALVLLSAIIINRLNPPPVGGSSSAVPIAAPPVVGDCLLTSMPHARHVGSPAHQQDPAPMGPYGPCPATRYGEITAVLSTSESAASSDENSAREWSLCLQSARDYLGLRQVVNNDFQTSSGWSPALNFVVGVGTPTIRQLAAGQHWRSCTIVNAYSGYGPFHTRQPNGDAYHGTVAGALLRGSLPSSFAACADGSEPTTTPRPCSGRHQFQLMGTKRLATARPNDAPALEAGCADLSITLTGIPDLPATGPLITQVVLSRYSQDSDVITSSLLTPLATAIKSATSTTDALDFSCLLSATGSRMMSESVLGLDARPLPLTK